MERVTANLHVQFKPNPAVYSCTVYSWMGLEQSHNLQQVGPTMVVHLQGYIVMNDSWYHVFEW